MDDPKPPLTDWLNSHDNLEAFVCGQSRPADRTERLQALTAFIERQLAIINSPDGPGETLN